MQASDQVLQTRIVHLPMAFNDKWTNDAIAKYMKSVRLSGPGPGPHRCRIARAFCGDMPPSCHDVCCRKRCLHMAVAGSFPGVTCSLKVCMHTYILNARTHAIWQRRCSTASSFSMHNLAQSPWTL